MKLKFRVWNILTKQWVRYFAIDNYRRVYEVVENHYVDGENILQQKYNIGAFEINLFTGITDINGVDIYFGDILKMHSEDETKYTYGNVIYLDESALWYIEGEINDGLGDMSYYNYLEVVGNIYENDLSEYVKD